MESILNQQAHFSFLKKRPTEAIFKKFEKWLVGKKSWNGKLEKASNKTYKQSIVMLIFAKYILNLQC